MLFVDVLWLRALLCAGGFRRRRLSKQSGEGEVTAPKCFYQAKVFHELNASSVELLQSVFVTSLHPHLCRPHQRASDGGSQAMSKPTSRTQKEVTEDAKQFQLGHWLFLWTSTRKSRVPCKLGQTSRRMGSHRHENVREV